MGTDNHDDYYTKFMDGLIEETQGMEPIKLFSQQIYADCYELLIIDCLKMVGIDNPSIMSYKAYGKGFWFFRKTYYVVECPELTESVMTALKIIS